MKTLIKLVNETLIRSLINQPESGMGFQNVILHMKDGSKRNGTVFNCENLSIDGFINQNDILKIVVKE